MLALARASLSSASFSGFDLLGGANGFGLFQCLFEMRICSSGPDHWRSQPGQHGQGKD
jgi:hypothetical protein